MSIFKSVKQVYWDINKGPSLYMASLLFNILFVAFRKDLKNI